MNKPVNIASVLVWNQSRKRKRILTRTFEILILFGLILWIGYKLLKH